MASSVDFLFKLKIDRIRISWTPHDQHLHHHQPHPDQYQLRAFLLEEITDGSSPRKRAIPLEERHRSLEALDSLNSSGYTSGSGLVEIHFGRGELAFQCKMVLDDDQRHYRPRIARLKLQHCSRTLAMPHHHQPVGFVDLELSHNLAPDQCRNLRLPMVLFADYHRKVVQHRCKHRAAQLDDNFRFDLWCNLESVPLISHANIDQLECLRRVDSLPNLSLDRELKYHDSPPSKRLTHLLNFFGFLPPGKLFRVSIHFGLVEHLEAKFGPLCACFEVKHHGSIFAPLREPELSNTICCRTRQLETRESTGNSTNDNESSGEFDQHFTFYERFCLDDSPWTCLSIQSVRGGKKLFKYKCHLGDYVTARSVNQYFMLHGKHGDFCRLQFSIAVKPVTSTDNTSKH